MLAGVHPLHPPTPVGAVKIRPYQPADEPALYDICLRTGDNGGDATGLYRDPRLLGHVYVGPYLALAPQLAFVLDSGEGTPVGYVLGAADTLEFERRCEQRWWPPLRRRYPDPPDPPRTPDEHMIALIHNPPPVAGEVATRYPSHLHIDLLPQAQGRGLGRALIQRLLDALTAAGSTGVHLGVGQANQNAIGFYGRLGFVEIVRSGGALTLARPL
jgi:ribosomal protein S18 acetylase RimI-like enzyme